MTAPASIAFCDGKFLPLDQARVGALDAGLQHAVGLFETMLGGVRSDQPDAQPHTQPWIVDLDAHTQRLAQSALELGLSTDLRPQALADAALQTVARSALPRARVRLTITGGDLNLLTRPAPGAPAQRALPTVLITATPATTYPAEMLARGVLVTLADTKANPFNPHESHKTLNYWWRLRELQLAGAKGAAEALVFDVTNHLVGGCVSNVFVVRQGVALTPFARGEEGIGPDGPTPDGDPDVQVARAKGSYLPSPTLPGVTRARVLDWLALGASAHPALAGVRTQRRALTISDVLDADEVFLTNSSWGILPVTRVEGRTIGAAPSAGSVGPITTALVQTWAKWTA